MKSDYKLLLRTFGNVATEKELARQSLTSRGGTEIWYLSRALRTRGIQTTVVIQSRIGNRLPHPSIAGVLLPGHAGHFVAVLDSNEAETTIADPLKGKIVLSRADLANGYDFTGFFLVFGKTNSQMNRGSTGHHHARSADCLRIKQAQR